MTTKIKLAIVGQNGVGKSGISICFFELRFVVVTLRFPAVTVRYLTKRFISEYSSHNGKNPLLLLIIISP